MEGHDPEEHTYRLSSIDQAAVRFYLRHCLFFPTTTDNGDIESIANRLTATVKRTVIQLPILTGRIRPEAVSEGGRSGRLEVTATLDGVNSFHPVIRRLTPEEFPYTYRDLEMARMPGAACSEEQLAPVAASLEPQNSAVFAIQANFISGGLIIVLCLHHSVSDLVGVETIISHLSSDLPSCKLRNTDLTYDALEQSRLRDRLSGSRGVKADMAVMAHADERALSLDAALQELSLVTELPTPRVLSFSLKLLEEATDLANERLAFKRNCQPDRVSCFDMLSAILWKGVARALSKGSTTNLDTTCSLIVPMNIRRMVEPQLEEYYCGNGEVPVIAQSPVVKLTMPFDVGSLLYAGRLTSAAIRTMSEQQVRSEIAAINESSDVQTAPINRVNQATDLVLTSSADLDLENAHLSLGLGPPSWMRKMRGARGTHQCLIHPIRKEERLCEVTVELAGDVMKSLLEDENFMTFVTRVV